MEMSKSFSPTSDDDDVRSAIKQFLYILIALAALLLLYELLSLGGVVNSSITGLKKSVWFSEGLFASYLLLLLSAGSGRKKAVIATGLGVVFWAFGFFFLRNILKSPDNVVVSAMLGFGASAILVQSITIIIATGARRREALIVFLPGIIVLGYVIVSWLYIPLTCTLRPTTYDAQTYAADFSFGHALCFDVGRFFKTFPIVQKIAECIYGLLPLGVVFLYSIKRRESPDSSANTLNGFLLPGVAGFFLYFVFPVVGPAYFFGDRFPFYPPLPGSLPANLPLTHTVPRNCMPSLHTAWALLIFWQARHCPRWVRAVAAVFFVGTLSATLGLGLHYVVDLIVAFPFTLAVLAFLSKKEKVGAERGKSLCWGTGLVLLWLLLIHSAGKLLLSHPVPVWLISLFTVGVSLVRERKLSSPIRSTAPVAAAPSAVWPALPPLLRKVAAIFFLSGLSGLIYQVVFAKALALTFGNTARATVTVLATYMAGLAAGTWAGGRIAPRIRNAIRTYAFAELGIGIWCLGSPLLLRLIRAAYVSLAAGSNPSRPSLILLQLALGALLLLPPTFLMGLTLPVLTKKMIERDESLGRSVGLLYSTNTFGAAAGAILAGYVLMPRNGIQQTLLVAVTLNILVAFLGIHLGKKLDDAAESEAPSPRPAGTVHERTVHHERSEPFSDRDVGRIGVVILILSGFVTFALEVTYTHLLAVVAGNSAYAFSLMLFSFLVGLGGGAICSRRLIAHRIDAILSVGLIEIGLIACILLGVFLWDGIPPYFASFDENPVAAGFGAREFIRFVVCCSAMIPAAFFLGLLYPMAMEWVGIGRPNQKVAAMGRAGALNTAGNIVGALVAGFYLLPVLGSLRTLHFLSVMAASAALLTLMVMKNRQRLAVVAGLLLVGILFTNQPATFNMDSLSSGANVYFQDQHYRNVIDYSESLDGGLTSVVRSRDPHGTDVLTMLTNGKFQGDNGKGREVTAQISFALFPQLHTEHRARALAIGLGTGTTLRVLHDGGFQQIDAVDLSADIIRLSREYFADVNAGVYGKDGVNTYVTDGRNFLLLQDRIYDLVSIEVSSIWFAGAASL